MPILKNARQEAFCQFRVTGKTQDEAYRLAGYKPSMPAASRLSTNVQVVARIAELQGKALARVEVTIDSMAAQFDEDRAYALKLGQVSAAVQAGACKAKLFGLFVDRSVSVSTFNHNYSSMSDEELRFEMAAIHQEVRAIKAGVKH